MNVQISHTDFIAIDGLAIFEDLIIKNLDKIYVWICPIFARPVTLNEWPAPEQQTAMSLLHLILYELFPLVFYGLIWVKT